MMSRKAWYGIALFLPVLVALFVTLTGNILPLDIIFFLIGPMIIAGPAFFIFAFGFIFWARKKSASQIWQSRYWLPLVFYPLAEAQVWLFENHQPLIGSAFSVLSIFGLVLFYGYAYILAGMLLTKLFAKIGLIHD